MRYRLECCRIFIIFKNSTTFCFSRWFSYGKADIIPRRYYTTKQVWQSDSMSSTLRQRRTIQLLGFIITPSSHANDVSMSASLRRSRYNLLRTLYHITKQLTSITAKIMMTRRLSASSSQALLSVGCIFLPGASTSKFYLPVKHFFLMASKTAGDTAGRKVSRS